ncbi:alkyl hydroperoxide reductase subunit F [Kordiimonas marina]|uniref:alkyl hydroperoxide reductase subunit F n=1 Tax=Kordiimonas marina TaxID=2872312 RepID=UPI001FF3DC18|nr:alkyl hydroperoxide reductase subunit F [Kordiimonas marina]MCJ9429643.1 alkyl hydroperoxide reductase subunit F [Kordiimonas marina]
MLTNDILEALKGYTAQMQNDVTFVLQTGTHEKRQELKDFLTAIASVSDRLRFEERDTNGVLRSPVSFLLERDGEDSGIRFSGIPGGHEFNSLILAVLHLSGTPMKLDDTVKTLIAGVSDTLDFQVFVSLSCHNCPDVVQALNQFAAINPNVRTEMIDGGLFPALVEENNIQGVPTVLLNGKPFATGKVDTSVIVAKLLEAKPAMKDAPARQEDALPVQDVTVIGGGPAGVSAAIYAARKGLKVTLIAERFGGQVKDTMGIENLISVPKTTGPELAGALMEHMRDYDITLKEHFRVAKVETGPVKKLTLTSGEVIETRTLIVATGAQWRELGVPGERENIGNGVAYCPHCDGPFFKGKDVAVIGGGNSGIEAALDLAGIVSSVTVFEFLPELKADQVLVKQALKRDNITIIKNAATKEITADGGKVDGLTYEDRASGELKRWDGAGVFVQIGLVPNSGFMDGVVERTRYGEIVINEKGETSEAGIYACGDVTTVPYKQIVIAMGEGAKASLAAFEYLMMNQDEQLAA